MSETRYIIDTSVFIQAYRAYYSFSLCPGFWSSLVALHNHGLVFSIDRVLDEICWGYEDELSIWAKKSMPKTCFLSAAEPAVIGWYAQIQAWANSQPQFTPSARSEFADETDAWIVAYAGARNMTVVTQEVFSPSIQRKIPIPNICKADAFKVNCLDVFEMLKRLGVQFGWDGSRKSH
jgi:hypothetical protein